ncbi:MAG TPA: response regulator transcription factor [Myxococcales bacterium]|nr:response regulator transcription factor [Myxococcales bacterium]
MPPQARVLLIDDDQKLARLLTEYLGGQGFSVSHAPDGPRGLAMASTGGYDAVLLDLMLPGMDGLTVCRRLREAGQSLPVVMLTARGEEADRVVGLELGADDYVAKPFSPRELLARLRAVLRRAHPDREGEARLERGGLALDPRTREVTLAGAPVRLTSYEFELLRLLMLEAGRVLSRERILDRLKGEEFESFDRSIDVHISRLRQKLGDSPRAPKLIKTVRGVGYLLAAEGEP